MLFPMGTQLTQYPLGATPLQSVFIHGMKTWGHIELFKPIQHQCLYPTQCLDEEEDLRALSRGGL